MTIRIQLSRSLDPSQPILEAVTLDGIGRCFEKCQVTTPHPVWRGAVLLKNHVKIVREK